MKKGSKKQALFNPYNSFWFLSITAFSLIWVMDYINSTVLIIQKILLVILTPIALTFYIKNKKPSKIFLLILLFWILVALSTLINLGDYQELARAAFSSLLLCSTLELGFATNKRKTLSAFALVWGALVAINALTMLVYYSPDPLQRGMFRDGIGDSNYYLLGQDNGTIFYSIPACILAMLYSIEKKSKISKKTLLFILFIGFAYITVFSGAGILSLVAVFIIGVLARSKSFCSAAAKNLTIKKILLITAIVFISIVLLRSSNILTDNIAHVLNKSSTFTGRTRLWDITTEHISKKPILGYGIQHRALRLAMIPYGKAHNMILQILFNGGLAAFFVYLIACIRSFSTNKTQQFTEKAVILCTFLVLLLVSNFDFYIWHPLTFMPMILFTLYNKQPTRSEEEAA